LIIFKNIRHGGIGFNLLDPFKRNVLYVSGDNRKNKHR